MPESLVTFSMRRDTDPNNRKEKIFVVWASSTPSTLAGETAGSDWVSKTCSHKRLAVAIEEVVNEMYRERSVLSACDPLSLSDRGKHRLQELVRILGEKPASGSDE